MISIYQIYYKPEHIMYLEPETIHYNNPLTGFEYDVMRHEYFSNRLFTRRETLIGFISWKWRQKTNISTITFREMIAHYEGFECYAFNPFPNAITSYYNVWIDGEKWHPGILNLTQDLFDKIGYNIDLSQRRHTLANATYCNYWVATRSVWDQYIQFIEPFRELMLREEWKDNIWNYPYIIERLFSEFIQINNISIKVFSKGYI